MPPSWRHLTASGAKPVLSLLYNLCFLLILLGPLLLLQRRLHIGLQTIFLLLTRRPDFALILFSFLFLPGVALHEASHYLMARLLQVRTERFSLVPKPLPDGRLRLGFVEVAPTDWLRDTLIGAAPLLTGGTFVAYVGLSRLGLASVWSDLGNGAFEQVWAAFVHLAQAPDFWLWFYLGFTVSSTMLPSPSDRRAWLPVGLVVLSLIGLAFVAGAGPWMLENAAPWVNLILQGLVITLGISTLLHLLIGIPVWVIQHLLARITGLRVIYDA
jgi:hypothetical protein